VSLYRRETLPVVHKVSHPLPWKSLMEMGALIQQQLATVRWNGEQSEWFGIGEGTRQGSNISTTVFNMYAEEIRRRTLESTPTALNMYAEEIR